MSGKAPIGRDGRKDPRGSYGINGDRAIGKNKEMIHQGDVRRIIIKNEEGRSLIEVPLSVGVVGAVLDPMWATKIPIWDHPILRAAPLLIHARASASDRTVGFENLISR